MAAIWRSILWTFASNASLRSDNLTSCRSVALGMFVSIPQLGAEELGLQPPKIAHLGRLTNRRNHGARTHDQAAAKREHKQEPDRESRQSHDGFTHKPTSGYRVGDSAPHGRDTDEND